MTIKFICSCGKHLKARDNMASRRSVCPRCGSPVGIPSLKPTHPGTVAAPMTPTERLRHTRDRKPIPAPTAVSAEPPKPIAPRPADPRLVRLLSSRGVRRPELTGRHLEKHWHHCLVYPLRAWRLCASLAVFLTVLSVAVALVLPHLLAQQTDTLSQIAVRLVLVPTFVLIVGFPCAFLDCVLESSVAGEVFYIVWSGSPAVVLLRSGLKWLASLLAGPILFLAVGYLYWLRSGDPGLLDYSILIELAIVGAAYWVFVLLSLTDQGRWRDLNPLAVADLAHRLGWRSLLVVLAAAAVFLIHGWVLADAIAEVHTKPMRGLALLTATWLSALYWSTFFCRLFGVWCHRSRIVAEDEEEIVP